MEEEKIKLLLVEDDQDFMDSLVPRLTRRGLDVVCALEAKRGLELIREGGIDVVVSDIRLPGMDGVMFLKAAKQIVGDLPVILLTGYGSLESAREAVKLDAFEYLLKPPGSIDDLMFPIHRAAESHRLKRKNRRLARELVQISERERCRIGEDLHDGVCQHLVGIQWLSESLVKDLRGENPKAAEAAAKIAELLRETVNKARSLAVQLYPVSIQRDGLTTALEGLASNIKDVFGVNCVFEASGSAGTEDTTVATHLYRIAQEAASNAIKHGGARDILISLNDTDDGVELAIRDDGRNCNGVPEKPSGMGTHILRHRAGLIGATIDVRSAGDRGTILTCVLGSEKADEKDFTKNEEI